MRVFSWTACKYQNTSHSSKRMHAGTQIEKRNQSIGRQLCIPSFFEHCRNLICNVLSYNQDILWIRQDINQYSEWFSKWWIVKKMILQAAYSMNLMMAAMRYANVNETKKIIVSFPKRGLLSSWQQAYIPNVIKRKTLETIKQLG